MSFHCESREFRRSPIVTGTTVLGVKYADGVMMISDTLGACPACAGRSRGPRARWWLRALVAQPALPTRCALPAGSYGNLARYTDLRRIRRVGDFTLLGASGEYSDFQYIMDNLHELV